MTDYEFERTARRWLDDGPTVIADRALQAALDEIHVTRQRRSWWPARRLAPMNNLVRAVAVLAVVVGAGLVAINVVPGGVGGQAVAPSTPSPAPSPSATPTPSSSNINPDTLFCRISGCVAGELDPGTYTFEAGTAGTPRRLSLTVPAGWTIDGDGFLAKEQGTPGEVILSVWTVTHIESTVCGDSSFVDAGTTADDLATVLVAQGGRAAAEATDVTLAGLPARRIELAVAPDADAVLCGSARVWPGPGPDGDSGWCCAAPGATDVIYVVDHDGDRIVVATRHQAERSRLADRELLAIVSSIAIEGAPRAP